MNFLSKLTTPCAVGIFLLSLVACSGGPKGEVTEKQAFVDSLIATMSLEAKVGEMTQLTLGTILQKENKTIIEPQHLDSSRARRPSLIIRWEASSTVEIMPIRRRNGTNSSRGFRSMRRGKHRAFLFCTGSMPYTVQRTRRRQCLARSKSGWPPHGMNRSFEKRSGHRRAGCCVRHSVEFFARTRFGPRSRWPRFWETFGEDRYSLLVSA